MDFVRLSQQTPIIFLNNNGPMITSTESNIFFILREWVVLLNDAIDCKVDEAAVVQEWNTSVQRWRNNTDRERLHGGTDLFYNIIKFNTWSTQTKHYH